MGDLELEFAKNKKVLDVLQAKKCSFSVTGRKTEQQSYYSCVTCGGFSMCLSCKRGSCHPADHKLELKQGGFFCDCGSGGRCKCLKTPYDAGASTGPKKSAEDIKLDKEIDMLFDTAMQKVLREKKCTFGVTGEDFQEQPFYSCITCGDGYSICANCKRGGCHPSTHKYEKRFSESYCDCGATGKCRVINTSYEEVLAKEDPKVREEMEKEWAKKDMVLEKAAPTVRQTLYAKKCSFPASGRDRVKQPIYHCETCGKNYGMCASCMRGGCHPPTHKIVEMVVENQWCDCGATGKCKCLNTPYDEAADLVVDPLEEEKELQKLIDGCGTIMAKLLNQGKCTYSYTKNSFKEKQPNYFCNSCRDVLCISCVFSGCHPPAHQIVFRGLGDGCSFCDCGKEAENKKTHVCKCATACIFSNPATVVAPADSAPTMVPVPNTLSYRCQQGHDLAKSDKAATCSVCKQEKPGSYSCTECKHELCFKCAEKATPSNPEFPGMTHKCPSGHDYEKDNYMSGYCSDDKCGLGLAGAYYCAPCKYAACYECIKKKKPVAPSAPLVLPPIQLEIPEAVRTSAAEKIANIHKILDKAVQVAPKDCAAALAEVAKARDAIIELENAPFTALVICQLEASNLRLRANRAVAQAHRKPNADVFQVKYQIASALVRTVRDRNAPMNQAKNTAQLRQAFEIIDELSRAPYALVPYFRTQVRILHQSAVKLVSTVFSPELFKTTTAAWVTKTENFLTAAEAESKQRTQVSFDNLELARDSLTDTLAIVAKELAPDEAKASSALMGRLRILVNDLWREVPKGITVSPTGGISDRIGQWLPFLDSGLELVFEVDTRAPAIIQNLLPTWNQNVACVNEALNKYIANSVLQATRLEAAFEKSGKATTNELTYIVFSTKEIKRQLEKLRLAVHFISKELIETDPTGLAAKLHQQYVTVKSRLIYYLDDHRVFKIQNYTKALQKAVLRCKELSHNNVIGAQTAEHSKGDLDKITKLAKTHLGPIQDEIEDRIKALAAIEGLITKQEKAEEKPKEKTFTLEDAVRMYDKVDTQFDPKTYETIEDFYLNAVRNMVHQVASHHDLSSFYRGSKRTDCKSLMQAIDRLAGFPQIYEYVVDRYQKEWDKRYLYSAPSTYVQGCEITFPPASSNPDPFLFTPSFMVTYCAASPFEPVAPGHPKQSGLPFGNVWKSKQNLQSSQMPTLAGKIVFSASGPISGTHVSEDALGTSFNLTQDLELEARAFFYTSIGNYAVGLNSITGAAYYIPTEVPVLNCYLKAKIDGKEIKNSVSMLNESIAHKVESLKSSSVAFTAVGNKYNEQGWASWDLGKRYLTKHLVAAGPGKHTVELSFHFSVVGQGYHFNTMQLHNDYPFPTVPSHAIAVGSFDITVPQVYEVPEYLPQWSGESVPLKMINTDVKRFAGATLVWIHQIQDWHVVEAEKEVVEQEWSKQRGQYVYVKKRIPPVYGKSYDFLIYYDPSSGHHGRECVQYGIQTVTAAGAKDWRNARNTLQPSFWDYFDADLLSTHKISQMESPEPGNPIPRCGQQKRFAKLYSPDHTSNYTDNNKWLP